MLAIEKISLRGLLNVAVLAAVFSGIIYAMAFLKVPLNLRYDYLIYVFLFGFFASFVALFVGKVGSILPFAAISGILLFPIPQLSSNGLHELAILMISALIFEILLCIVKRSALALVLTAVVALAAIPPTMLLLVGQFYETLLKSTINFSILCGILGLFAALLAVGLWEILKTRTFIIKLRVLS